MKTLTARHFDYCIGVGTGGGIDEVDGVVNGAVRVTL
jgi:hypothetical protein